MQKIFKFVSYSFDLDKYVLKLEYKYSNLDYNFVEKLDFSDFKGLEFDLNELDSVFQIIFLVFGISYYKVFASGVVDLNGIKLNDKQADFLNFFYKNGLSEFIYQNQLDWNQNIPDFHQFVVSDVTLVKSSKKLADKSLLAWGGGKDSIVSSVILDKLNINYDLFCVQDDRIKIDTAKVNGRKLNVVRRELDSRLFELNNSGVVYNGHVPITGMLAFVKVLIALASGYSNVVLSNEYSASEGNLIYKNERVNHQFSKDYDFEQKICSYVNTFIHEDLKYYSLLRPFYEIKIAKIFAENAGEYFSSFSSCNKNFHINDKKKLVSSRFSSSCEKCAFVFLILAPFLPKSELINIFGKNMLDDLDNFSVYQDLLGLTDKKPFECVGTFDECRMAIKLLLVNPNWKDSIIVAKFKDLKFEGVVDSFYELQSDYSFSKDLYLRIKNEFE